MGEGKGINDIDLVRSLLLSKGHGQFDLLPRVLSERELLKEKPVVLVKILCEKLNLTSSDFNTGSFRNWLSRYRAKNATQGEEREKKLLQTPPSPLSGFKLTDPETLPKEERPLIKKPSKAQ